MVVEEKEGYPIYNFDREEDVYVGSFSVGKTFLTVSSYAPVECQGMKNYNITTTHQAIGQSAAETEVKACFSTFKNNILREKKKFMGMIGFDEMDTDIIQNFTMKFDPIDFVVRPNYNFNGGSLIKLQDPVAISLFHSVMQDYSFNTLNDSTIKEKEEAVINKMTSENKKIIAEIREKFNTTQEGRKYTVFDAEMTRMTAYVFFVDKEERIYVEAIISYEVNPEGNVDTEIVLLSTKIIRFDATDTQISEMARLACMIMLMFIVYIKFAGMRYIYKGEKSIVRVLRISLFFVFYLIGIAAEILYVWYKEQSGAFNFEFKLNNSGTEAITEEQLIMLPYIVSNLRVLKGFSNLFLSYHII